MSKPVKSKSTPSRGAVIAFGSESVSLVSIAHGQPVTTTERVAFAAGLQHASVIKLVRLHLADFEKFGPIRFEIRMGKRGGVPVEYAELNEQQATLLFMFMKNSPIVREVKVRLVGEFYSAKAEIERLKGMQKVPSWRAVRIDVASSQSAVNDMLKECRADEGKETAAHVYMNENKLLRHAMTGTDAKWDRDALSAEELKLLSKVQQFDMRLIARSVPFADRKTRCREFVLQQRTQALAAPAVVPKLAKSPKKKAA